MLASSIKAMQTELLLELLNIKKHYKGWLIIMEIINAGTKKTHSLDLSLNLFDWSKAKGNGQIWIPYDFAKDDAFNDFIMDVTEAFANGEDEFGGTVDYGRTRVYIVADCEGVGEAEFNIGIYCYPSLINQVDPEPTKEWLNDPKNKEGALTFPNDNGFYEEFDNDEKLAILTQLVGRGILGVANAPAQ